MMKIENFGWCRECGTKFTASHKRCPVCNREPVICPMCSEPFFEYPALSRRDNKTEICSNCGQNEAMADYFRK